jgi:ubiquinone/menaquinone biosynthesis C-methylase UbiE
MMSFKMNSGLGKRILSLIREGDYAHPGEEKAIDLVFRDISKSKDRAILDVGCGLCGTAMYLQNHGYGQITGIDLNPETIPIVNKKYPEFNIIQADVNKVSEVFEEKFDMIYLFNSFYAFPDHSQAIEALRKVAQINTDLIIFDYADAGKYKAESLEIPNPLKLDKIETILTKNSWRLTELKDISDLYTTWYTEFCHKVESKKAKIVKLADEVVYDYVLEQYSRMLELYQKDILRGVILRAKAV